jgi:hypothetical protein
MPEKINISERLIKNDLVAHALIAAASPIIESGDDEWLINKDIEVKLTFNGIEVPFVEFLERFNEQADEWVETEAHRLVEGKLWEITLKADAFNKALLEEADKLLPNRKKNEDWD